MILRLVRFWNEGQKHEVIKYKETIISRPIPKKRDTILRGGTVIPNLAVLNFSMTRADGLMRQRVTLPCMPSGGRKAMKWVLK